MKTDFIDICLGIINENLNEINLEFENKATVCKYLVPKNYPSKCNQEEIIISEIENSNNIIFSSIVDKNSNENSKNYYTKGSRTIAIVCKDDNIYNSAKSVNLLIEKLYTGDELRYRKDIGLNFKDIQTKNINNASLSYKSSGVDIEKVSNVLNSTGSTIKTTYNDNVMSGHGQFCGLMKIPDEHKDSLLAFSTDGVGTKSIILENCMGSDGYYNLGYDIVNHCTDDILVSGARPYSFLDYFASSKINTDKLESFIKGVSNACKDVNCVLIGGETAEMPQVYQNNMSDLVGTMIGFCKPKYHINPKNIQENNLIYGLTSSGLHTNGYSLVRKIIEKIGGYHNIPENIKEDLCQSHKSYLSMISTIQESEIQINGLCHITGGGFKENLNRIIPEDLKVNLNYDKIRSELPDVFKWIQKWGNIEWEEMLSTFNCGYGMLIIVDSQYKLNELFPQCVYLGTITK